MDAEMRWSGVCEGHDTDVPRTGMYKDGFGDSMCLLLRVAGRWRSTSPRTLIREDTKLQTVWGGEDVDRHTVGEVGRGSSGR